jgi:hypothetical protein
VGAAATEAGRGEAELMPTWRVTLRWDRSIFVDAEGQYASTAFVVARPVLQQMVAEGPEVFRDRVVDFAACDFRQLEAGGQLKSARVA